MWHKGFAGFFIIATLVVPALASLDSDLSDDVLALDSLALDDTRSLLQIPAAGTYGSGGAGGYGTYGYGGYGYTSAGEPAAFQEARPQCEIQTRNSNFVVYLAMLQPLVPLTDSEEAQDGSTGMMTLYVDDRTGNLYAAGEVRNIQNLTAITVNAGNLTEAGPVVVPLLPSTTALSVDGEPSSTASLRSNGTLLATLVNATGLNNTSSNTTNATATAASADAGEDNAGEDNTTATTAAPSVSVQIFNPPLPWLSTLMFSQRVGFNQVLPMVANASVPTPRLSTNSTNSTITSPGGAVASTATASSVGSENLQANNQPMQPANISQYITALNETYTINGTSYPVRNESITADNDTSGAVAATQAAQSSTRGNAGQQQQQLVVTNVAALLNHGLAYVSVWAAQGGRQEVLRGQLVKYGNFSGASPSIASQFPDALVPQPTYNVTVCSTPPPAPRQERAAGGPRGAGSSDNTTDVHGADVIGNNFARNASKYIPIALTAMRDIQARQNSAPAAPGSASNQDGNANQPLRGNYSIFTAALAVAAQMVGNSSNVAERQVQDVGSNAAAARNATVAAAQGGGRKLQQAAEPAAAAGSTSLNASAAPNVDANAATIFAPTNQAIARALTALNVTQEQFLANKSLLLQILSFHILPGTALTTAALAVYRRIGNQLETLLPFNNIGYVPGRNGGNATLYGAGTSSALVVDANMKAGNGVIVQGIDGVLIPPQLYNALQQMTNGTRTAANQAYNSTYAATEGNRSAANDAARNAAATTASAGRKLLRNMGWLQW